MWPLIDEPRWVRTDLIPCRQCGSPVAMLIFSENGLTQGELENQARLMFQKTRDLNVPTWVIGREKEVNIKGKLDGEALIMKVWPEREKPARRLSQEFHQVLDNLIDGHCKKAKKKSPKPFSKLTAKDFKELGSCYAAWRGYLESFIGELVSEHPISTGYRHEVEEYLGFTKENSGWNEAEKALIEDYIVFQYHHPTTWIKEAIQKKSRTLKESSKIIAQTLDRTYFTGLKILKVLNEEQGVMKVYDTVTKKQRLFIDRAFCQTACRFDDGLYLLSTIVDTNGFLFTTGAGIPVDSANMSGLFIIQLLESYLDALAYSTPSFEEVKKIISYTLTNRLLKFKTIHYF